MKTKTIEERAIADANRAVGESNILDKWLSHKIAYERVAKEQQEIDIQRAVEILRATNYFNDEEFGEDVLIDQFKQLMKGE